MQSKQLTCINLVSPEYDAASVTSCFHPPVLCAFLECRIKNAGWKRQDAQLKKCALKTYEHN